MAITNGYVTLDEYKGWPKIDTSDTRDNAELEVAIEAASRAIDNHCDRWFYVTGEQSRVYTPTNWRSVWTDDIVTVTAVKTDPGGDGTYEVTWATSDYELYPANAALDGEPWRKIAKADRGRYSFPALQKSVEVTGTFGWAAVPTAVKAACVMQATRLHRRTKEAPMGIVHLPGVDGVGGMHVGRLLDGDVALLLTDYVRNKVRV